MNRNEIIKELLNQVKQRSKFFIIKYHNSLNSMSYNDLIKHYNKYNKVLIKNVQI